MPSSLLAEPLTQPPLRVRARVFSYNFTSWGEAAWYKRAFVRDYFPPVQRGAKLTNLMRVLPSR